MLKHDVQEQLKSLLSYQEDSLKERQRAKAIGNLFFSDTDETLKKDIKALKIAIKAVENYDYDEREKITVEVMAIKAAEGGAYYYDLETGERLVIRENKIEGIYNPGEDKEIKKYKKFLYRLVSEMQCPNCPARYTCTERGKDYIPREKCEDHLFETLTE